MAEYLDALDGLTQDALDDCDTSFMANTRAIYPYLKVGAMHGVTIGFERRYDIDGRIPGLVRDGAVMRFLLPVGVRLADLATGLGEEGRTAGLIERLLAGHRLSLEPQRATGRLTAEAEAVRDLLIDDIATLGSAWHGTARLPGQGLGLAA